MLSVVSTTHDIDLQMYPKQALFSGMISSQSLRCPGYARDCHLDVSGSGGGVGGNVPRRNGPMLTPGKSAYVAGIFLSASIPLSSLLYHVLELYESRRQKDD